MIFRSTSFASNGSMNIQTGTDPQVALQHYSSWCLYTSIRYRGDFQDTQLVAFVFFLSCIVVAVKL